MSCYSVDPAEDIFPYAMVTPESRVKYNSSVAFSSRHQWFYFPQQTPDEALVFYGGFEHRWENTPWHKALPLTLMDPSIPYFKIACH